MRKIILQILLLLVCTATVLAQAPQKFNYQGVARDGTGNPLASTAIGLRLTIHDGSTTGTVVYQETHSVTTNAFGLYNVAVGGGTVTSGTFATINWAGGSKYLEVELDPTGGSSYTSVGANQLLSVPYAMYAASAAGGGSGTVTSITAGTGLSGGTITTSGTISMPNVGTPGTYGSATQVPVFTTDAQGRVTGVTNTTITAGGTGTVTSVNTTAPLTGGPITSSGTIGMSTSGVSAGTYGSATQVPQIAIDAYGRVTSAANVTITGGGGVTSTGTANYISKFTSPTAIANSGLYQNGSKIGLGTTAPSATLTMTSAADTEILFINQTGTPTTYGTERIEYNGAADASRVSLLATAIRTTVDANGIGIEGAGPELGAYGYGQSSTGSQVTGTEGDGFGSGTYSVGVSGFADRNGVISPTNAYGVYGYATNGLTNYAMYADGNMRVAGTLSKASGTFEIDHPLDPANKYLYHSFVESPDMMNIYNGNITTDASGVATVMLPNYFDALNKDFRYQLTVIGTFAQAIISKEISGNIFEIKTNEPNVKVSWQVTGVRQDAWANAHRVVPEVDKEPNNKGKYLAPKELGQPESLKIGGDLRRQQNAGNVLPVKAGN